LLSKLSTFLHFDDSASATTGDSHSEYTWSDASEDDDSASVLSKTSKSLFSSVYFSEESRISETKKHLPSHDEEEGSNISRFGASTSSIRSRFTNSGNRCLDPINENHKLEPTKRDVAHITQIKSAETTSIKDGRIISKSTKTADQREQRNRHKQGLIDKHKESANPRSQAQEKILDNYLLKQERNKSVVMANPSVAGSRTSMDEIDLNSVLC
jgi:hypothetical protein